jgi:hypothetical protein
VERVLSWYQANLRGALHDSIHAGMPYHSIAFRIISIHAVVYQGVLRLIYMNVAYFCT